MTDNTKLSHLVMGLPVSDTRGTMDRAVREVAYDSRKVGPDSLFVAIPGGNLDGGAFIKDA
ncbi:MAG: UDP-N-acetylmuramoyl-L-alanyl-D-glutamate--2,6-diaminopimelate ligase, partial [Nitrospina sp.]|nr:UDP-N-acetylmuramoyl-L-alanyl-D-glutamate--2,6-diaminopimelate ligase [Nitrospina sp.]